MRKNRCKIAVRRKEYNYAIRDHGTDIQDRETEFVDHGCFGAVLKREFEVLSCGAARQVPCNEIGFWDYVPTGEGGNVCRRKIGE